MLCMYHQKNLGMSQTPPLLGGAKIAAGVLHTMNIEGQIHQKNPGMGQTPPPFLAMPGFWKRLSLQALPKGGTENIQSFVTFWLWTVSLRVHLLIRKPSQHLIAKFVLKN